ncbi:hypothetical protein ACFL0I_04255, partial [Gemmatimonadota bacterium]
VHEAARAWWEETLSRPAPAVGLVWVVALGYLRLTTHPRVMTRPLTAFIPWPERFISASRRRATSGSRVSVVRMSTS